jgi:hypothetical protein
MNSMMRSVLLIVALLALGAGARRSRPTGFLHPAPAPAGCRSRRPRRRQPAAQQLLDRRSGSHAWHAYLSMQAADRRAAINPRPHRPRALAEQQRRGHCQGHRRAAQGQQPDQAADLTEKTCRRGRGKYPQPARCADRLAAGRQNISLGEDKTCRNWTSSTGFGVVAASTGRGCDDDASKSWNSRILARPGRRRSQTGLPAPAATGCLACCIN